MQKSYIDYAMSVIVQRALPDVRDGFKNLYTGVFYMLCRKRAWLPTSRIKNPPVLFGEVLGKYHPHGDKAVYDAIGTPCAGFFHPLSDG